MSAASRQQHNQDLREKYKVGQILNSSLVFLLECIAFNQSALHHFLQECSVPFLSSSAR